jgi:hypothetical protein
MQGEITTSSTYVDSLSPTLLSNKNQKGFQTIFRRNGGYRNWIHILSSLM